MDRYFKVVKVTKTAQKNSNTKFDKLDSMVFTGTPSAAASKAFYQACKKIGKRISGKCTLSIMVVEVLKKTINGAFVYPPKLDSANKPKIYKYSLSLHRYDSKPSKGKVVDFKNTNDPITFKYFSTINKSFGRINTKNIVNKVLNV